jgi:hypothetical protein
MNQDLKLNNFETWFIAKLEIQLDLIEGSHEEFQKASEDIKST